MNDAKMNDAKMKTVLFTTDLMASSKIAPAAAEVQLALQTVGSLEALAAAAKDARLVVVDLNSVTGDVRDLIAGLKSLPHSPTVLAFGPHVHEAKLKAASEAGCNGVFSRGQFHAQTAEILKRFAT